MTRMKINPRSIITLHYIAGYNDQPCSLDMRKWVRIDSHLSLALASSQAVVSKYLN